MSSSFSCLPAAPIASSSPSSSLSSLPSSASITTLTSGAAPSPQISIILTPNSSCTNGQSSCSPASTGSANVSLRQQKVSLPISSSIPTEASTPQVQLCIEIATSSPSDTAMSLSSSTPMPTPTSSVLPTSMADSNGTSTGGRMADSICVNGFCFSELTVIIGASLIGLGVLSLGIACIIFARQRRRRRTHNASVSASGKEAMLEAGQSPSLAAVAVAAPKRSSVPIVPMAVTQLSNAGIEAGLNDVAEDIKNIANRAGSRVWFDKEKGPVFVHAIQVAQGGVAPPIGGGKIEATQALRAAIAMLLTDRVLPGEPQPVHPLMKSGDRREFDQWVRVQPTFEGMAKLTPDRRRLWVAKFVKENLETSAMLRAQRAEVMGIAISEVEGAISKLYEDWDAEEMRPMVEDMVEKALNLGCEMMGKDLVMTMRWVLPGQTFDDGRMDMTDLRAVDGLVALCVFPGWADADGYLISSPKVYCV